MKNAQAIKDEITEFLSARGGTRIKVIVHPYPWTVYVSSIGITFRFRKKDMCLDLLFDEDLPDEAILGYTKRAINAYFRRSI